MDQDLSRLIELWSTLPEKMREAVLALMEASIGK